MASPRTSVMVADETERRTDLVQLAQWIRAAILGAKRWVAFNRIASACVAVGEFVSVSTQRDIEKASKTNTTVCLDGVGKTEKMSPVIILDPNLSQGLSPGNSPIATKAVSFLKLGCIYRTTCYSDCRLVVIAVASSIALLGFGCFGAYLWGSPARVSAARVVFGGWFAMTITYVSYKDIIAIVPRYDGRPSNEESVGSTDPIVIKRFKDSMNGKESDESSTTMKCTNEMMKLKMVMLWFQMLIRLKLIQWGCWGGQRPRPRPLRGMMNNFMHWEGTVESIQTNWIDNVGTVDPTQSFTGIPRVERFVDLNLIGPNGAAREGVGIGKNGRRDLLVRRVKNGVEVAMPWYLSRTLLMASPRTSVTVADETDRRIDLVQRAQWIRAAILGANDGLLSTASLMLGIGAANDERRSMILPGLAGALAGACSMAVGEFVSVSTQRDIEKASKTDITVCLDGVGKTEKMSPVITLDQNLAQGLSPGKSPIVTKAVVTLMQDDDMGNALPNPYKAASASALAFLCGSVVPLASAAFIEQHVIRIVAIAVSSSIALLVFGCFGAYLGGSPVRVSAARVVFGGWFAMAITYCLLKPFDRHHKGKDD
ncbi:Diacylglycerol acyltransferase family isoform 1 [Hibiscus syriacus]|uniref:Diacylglycerol acyltransferase family isoform 1 n=1 Tax=Hibiscus syriacus TaxID=106335 RepID=A0A6A2ZW19_HIBSY|nr:Diacylglycerol acyltransferase family isoform 1 [Hibiscus syriacus]